jgi:hypothetical protein
VAGNVFISYSREDQDYVERLVAWLRARGANVWLDHLVNYGTRWASVIEAKIRDCSAMLVVMTPRSQESTWVEREVFEAEKRHKPIFPLLLDGEVWFRLNNYHCEVVTAGAMPTDRFVAAVVAGAPSDDGSSRWVKARPRPARMLDDFRAAAVDLNAADLDERREAAARFRTIAVLLDLADIRAFSQSKNSGERMGAAIAIGVQIPDSSVERQDELGNELGKLLIDTGSSRVRYRAAEALTASTRLTKRFENQLRHLAGSDSNIYVREMANRALVRAKMAPRRS